MITKTFTRKQLISLTDGRLSTDISDVYIMLNHIFATKLFTHQLPDAMTRLEELSPEWYLKEKSFLETIPDDVKNDWGIFIEFIDSVNIDIEIPQFI